MSEPGKSSSTHSEGKAEGSDPALRGRLRTFMLGIVQFSGCNDHLWLVRNAEAVLRELDAEGSFGGSIPSEGI